MAGRRVETFEERFWSKVRKTDGCWLWTAYKTRTGYGKIRRGEKLVSAHRVSWELHNGPIPEGLCVLHECDNPACVNPAHLFLGTQVDNVADMVSKGRQRAPEGASVGTAKLAPAQVLEIRSRQGQGQSQRALAREFGVSKSQIGNILSGSFWRHLVTPRTASGATA